MNSLPSSVNFAEVLPSLPENATRYSATLAPTNGATFTAGNQIIFQYANRGYLIPDSVYLRYKLVAVIGATATGILGTPFFTSFSRLETQFGSTNVDSINNYNQVNNFLTQTTMDWAQKYGNAYNYGFDATAPASTEEMDGRALPLNVTTTLSLAGPVPCLLTNIVDKLLPLGLMPTIQQTFTIDSLANILLNTTAITSFTLSNVELCYDFIDLGSDVDAMVRGMGEKIYIKSQSFSNSAMTVPVGTSGSQSYTFNQRYASIKAAIVLFSGGVNGLFDSRDITSNTGSMNINIAGVNYPQTRYSMLNNKAALLIELKKVMGSIYDKLNNFSINVAEFNAIEATVTTLSIPGKFYAGFNLQKLHSNALLTGISSNNSNITVSIDSTIATAAARQCCLILAYDALIEVDVINKQASVKS